MRVWLLAATAALAACASYTPQPLPAPGDALAAPVAGVLEQRADAIQRPWLKPVALDLSAPLTPEAVAALAVANNPGLAAQRAQLGVAGAQVFAAGLLPDPTFSAGGSKVLSGPDPFLDLSGALGIDLAALRTRTVRREQAVANQEQVRLDLAWAEWQTAGDARLQAVRIQRLGRMVALTQASRDTALSLFERTSRAAARGDLAADRVEAARLALASATEALRSAENDLATANGELRRLLGLPPDFALRLADAALPPAPPPAAALTELATANRTDLAALRQGYASQEAAVHLAVLEQFPNLGLTLNTQRDSAGNLLVGPSVDFTLPLWNRNRGAIATETATRAALEAEYRARLLQTRAEIAAAETGLALAARRREAAAADLPQLTAYARAARAAAERGDLSRDAAETAEQALRDREMQLTQAELDYAEQSIALEVLTGTPREAWPQ